MTGGLLALAAAQSVLLVVVVVLFLRRDREREAAWIDERRELITRVQRPELIPVKRPTAERPQEPPKPTGLHKVGTVAMPGADPDEEQ